jgi:hypothetical protein
VTGGGGSSAISDLGGTNLAPAQIAEAQRMASEWKPTKLRSESLRHERSSNRPPPYPHMIRIAITAEAFDAVAATLPLGTVAYGAEIAASGERSIWVERSALDRLELVVRLALLDAEVRGLKELHAEVRAARDAWHAQAERVTLAPERRPWWRRLAGFG